jgi:hypothetical protein
MREYYQCPVHQRPKIFGMTASPIWNAKDAVNSLIALEKNLNASVVTVREHATELSDCSPRPKEVAISHSRPILPTDETARLDNTAVPPATNGVPLLPSSHSLESMWHYSPFSRNHDTLDEDPNPLSFRL